MKIATLFALVVAMGSLAQKVPAPSQTQAMYNAAAASAEKKLRHIEENGQHAKPDQNPTTLTEREINAYVNSGKVQLPTGVRRVEFIGHPGTVVADANVDFDAITASRRSSNPLLSLFRGVHNVHANARAEGSGGTGRVHIESVEIDGVGVPRIALEYFVDHYIRPKHPEIGLDSTFRMPERIDLAQVGEQRLTVTQK